jgi:hypothetical protein
MIDIFKDVPEILRKTTTVDNWSEFTSWEKTKKELGIEFYLLILTLLGKNELLKELIDLLEDFSLNEQILIILLNNKFKLLKTGLIIDQWLV